MTHLSGPSMRLLLVPNEAHSHIAVKRFGKRPLNVAEMTAYALRASGSCVPLYACSYLTEASVDTEGPHSCLLSYGDAFKFLKSHSFPFPLRTYRYFPLALRPDLSTSPHCEGDLDPWSWKEGQSLRLRRDTKNPTKITKHHVSTFYVHVC
jgi:hypothetical protein